MSPQWIDVAYAALAAILPFIHLLVLWIAPTIDIDGEVSDFTIGLTFFAVIEGINPPSSASVRCSTVAAASAFHRKHARHRTAGPCHHSREGHDPSDWSRHSSIDSSDFDLHCGVVRQRFDTDKRP